MKYKNGKKYRLEHNGWVVNFTLSNFSDKVVDDFNRELAEQKLRQWEYNRKEIS